VSVNWPTIFRKIQKLEIEGEILNADDEEIFNALRAGAFRLFDSVKVVNIVKHEITCLSRPQDAVEVNKVYARVLVAFKNYFKWRCSTSSSTIKAPKIVVCENGGANVGQF
jgi:hypothetical protein